jgi:hypothetical protein
MSDENPVQRVEGMEEEVKNDVMEEGEKENIDPGSNSTAAVGNGGNESDGAVAGLSGTRGRRPVTSADGNAGDIVGNVPPESMIEICRGLVQRMGTLQRTEFAGHFCGVLANDANAFGPIIQVSIVVVFLYFVDQLEVDMSIALPVQSSLCW